MIKSPKFDRNPVCKQYKLKTVNGVIHATNTPIMINIVKAALASFLNLCDKLCLALLLFSWFEGCTAVRRMALSCFLTALKI